MIDGTHDPRAQSWLASANTAATDFPLQNLPLCAFEPASGGGRRIGVGIGDAILDLRAAAGRRLLGLDDGTRVACEGESLDGLFRLGRPALRQVRHAVFDLLREGTPANRDDVGACLVPQAEARFSLACTVGNYTDFFTSLNHALNCTEVLRPGEALGANYQHLPIAYHGRASSLVVGGTPLRRPSGQWLDTDGTRRFGPTRKLDFELEVAAFIAGGNALGRPVAVEQAEDHVAGFALLNDWSARDVQAWEAQPLGPFLAKNFMSSLSPWVVTTDALEPFRVKAAPRTPDAPPLADYLRDTRELTSFDLRLAVHLQTARMREAGDAPVLLTESRFARDLYWTPAQWIAHHTVNGCNLQAGDVIGSGTVSGPTPGTEGCLLELTANGRRPIALPNGETRAFLEDGDEVSLSAACEAPGARRIGFGRCVGRVVSELR